MQGEDKTTITLKKATRDRLDRFGKQHLEALRPTHDDIVTALLDFTEATSDAKSGRARASRSAAPAAP